MFSPLTGTQIRMVRPHLTRLRRTGRLAALVGIAVAVLLAASACTTSTDDQQQAQAEQPAQAQQSQQAETTAESTSQTSTSSTSGSGSTAAASRAATQAAQPAEQEQAAAEAAEQTEASDDDAVQQQEDGGMGGMQGGMSVAIIEEADYDDLSPRLQLLRDSGYPVYVSDYGYTIALGTPDLSPGTHRISVVIEGPVGLVEFPALGVTVLPQDAPEDLEEVVARFARFPDGVRGFHVTSVNFTGPGRWNLILHIPSENGFDDVGIALDVAIDTSAPSVGDPAPPSQSRTLTDVANIADLSTGETPDPGLYLISLADAVAADKPFVVVFASPGFCTNAFCGPQAEVLSEVRGIYGDAANYVHVDLFENPEQVRLGEEPIETPILEEWGLHTDEWTFVVNAQGVVVARFEAFAPLAEVDAALAKLLEG